MKNEAGSLDNIKSMYALWNDQTSQASSSGGAECNGGDGGCSASSGDGCHGDGECGGDGE